MQPSGKASIVECNVNIDDEPVGYKEYSEKQRSRSSSIVGGTAPGSGTSNPSSVGGGDEGTMGPVRAVQKAKAGGEEEGDSATAGVFTAFGELRDESTVRPPLLLRLTQPPLKQRGLPPRRLVLLQPPRLYQ